MKIPSLEELLERLRKTKEEHAKLLKHANKRKEAGVAYFVPTKKQYEALQYLNNNDTRFVGFGGAAGSSKTYLGCFWVASKALEYPNATFFVGRKTLVSLRQTTLVTFFNVLKELNITEKQYKFNAQDNELRFNNGSKVYFKDMDWKPSDPLYTRFGGLELTGAFIDEANEVPEKAIEIITSRVGRKNTFTQPSGEKVEVPSKILCTFNPDKGYVYRKFYEPYKNNAQTRDTVFIPAFTWENPHNTEDYIRNLYNLPVITRSRLLFGNFDYDDDDNTLVNYEQITALFTNIAEQVTPMFLVVDPASGGKDATVYSVWRGLELVKLVITNKHNVQEVIDTTLALKAEYGVANKNVIVDAIGVGEGVAHAHMLTGCVPYKASNAPIPQRHEAAPTKDFLLAPKVERAQYANLRSQCGWKLAEMIKRGEVSVRVHEEEVVDLGDVQKTLRSAIEEELSLLRDANPHKDEQKKRLIGKDEMRQYLGRSPGILDVFLMRMYYELIGGYRDAYSTPTVVRERLADFFAQRRNRQRYNSTL